MLLSLVGMGFAATGSSMVTILNQLSLQGHNGICLAIHSLFNKKAKEKLVASGAVAIITCNTISDPTNKINMLDLIATNLGKIMGEI